MLIFNKQFRAEEKVINELRKKIKKTENFDRLDGIFDRLDSKDNCEKYVLDNITISFNVLDGDLTVTDKNNNEIVTINCGFKDEPLQQARYNWFSDLLDFARKRFEEKEMKMAKIKEIQKAKNAVETAQKAKADQDAQRLEMLNAAKRIKGL